MILLFPEVCCFSFCCDMNFFVEVYKGLFLVVQFFFLGDFALLCCFVLCFVFRKKKKTQNEQNWEKQKSSGCDVFSSCCAVTSLICFAILIRPARYWVRQSNNCRTFLSPPKKNAYKTHPHKDGTPFSIGTKINWKCWNVTQNKMHLKSFFGE